jgi:hypothetical protein
VVSGVSRSTAVAFEAVTDFERGGLRTAVTAAHKAKSRPVAGSTDRRQVVSHYLLDDLSGAWRG